MESRAGRSLEESGGGSFLGGIGFGDVFVWRRAATKGMAREIDRGARGAMGVPRQKLTLLRWSQMENGRILAC